MSVYQRAQSGHYGYQCQNTEARMIQARHKGAFLFFRSTLPASRFPETLLQFPDMAELRLAG
jgi:hypothetical protein